MGKKKILLISFSFIFVFSIAVLLNTKVFAETKVSAAKYSNNNQPSSKSNARLLSNTSYSLTFDQNGGYGLECDDGITTYKSDGVCSGTVSAGTEISFPASSSKMVEYNTNQLIGWSKDPDCVTDNIYYDKKYTVNDTSKFYACYYEVIDGERYIQEGAVADGSEAIQCGSKDYILQCFREEGIDYCYDTLGRKLYRNKLATSIEGANNTCSTTSSLTDTINEYRYVTVSSNDYACGEALYITACTTDSCNYSKISKMDGTEVEKNGTVVRSTLNTSSDSAGAACKSNTVTEETKKCVNNGVTQRRKKDSYSICYNKNDSIETIKSNLAKYYSCDTTNGYYFDNTAIAPESEEVCNSEGICTRTYSVSCTKGSKAKPSLAVSSALVQGNNIGVISVEANATEGTITSYYSSLEYYAPTNGSKWNDLTDKSFTIESTPGVLYIWVKDSKGNISNAVSGAVIDTQNVDTTLNKIELYDDNGQIQTATSVSYNTDKMKDNKYVRLSNDLSKDSKALADAFNPFDTEYKLDVESPTLTVYATLTSNDAKYVDGYEPRTVNLNYGMNTILIKIENKEGKTRTYTILANRVDDRSSDNTLSELNVSVGDIEFNSNTTDYKIEIPSSTRTVDVSSKIESKLSKYVEGYEPGTVTIEGDTTVKLIKVISQTGSTRTYVLTFIKKGTDLIEDESLQLKDLVIPGVYLPFESNISNYSVSVDYEIDSIDLITTLQNENSFVVRSIKHKGEQDYVTGSNIGIGLDVGENFLEIKVTNSNGDESYYRLTIVRKEFGLDVSDETRLKDLRVLGHNIKFDPVKKDYTVRIKQEKSLVITAVPESSRAEVFIRGNEELTGFSTVRIKVVAENGKNDIYSIDIKKDAFNKTIEIASIIIGAVIILVSSCIIIMKKKKKAKKEYYEG